jgi:hypothetical protein
MSRDYKNHYCLLTDQIESTVVFWATIYCLLNDQLLSFDRPIKPKKTNIYKGRRWFFCLTNRFITILNQVGCGKHRREVM